MNLPKDTEYILTENLKQIREAYEGHDPDMSKPLERITYAQSCIITAFVDILVENKNEKEAMNLTDDQIQELDSQIITGEEAIRILPGTGIEKTITEVVFNATARMSDILAGEPVEGSDNTPDTSVVPPEFIKVSNAPAQGFHWGGLLKKQEQKTPIPQDNVPDTPTMAKIRNTLSRTGIFTLECHNGQTGAGSAVVDRININELKGCVVIRDMLLELARKKDEKKPEQKKPPRYFFDLETFKIIRPGECARLSADEDIQWDRYLEVTEADLPYLRKPEGDWEFRKVEKGDSFYHEVQDMEDYIIAATAVFDNECYQNFLQGYRWCRPVGKEEDTRLSFEELKQRLHIAARTGFALDELKRAFKKEEDTPRMQKIRDTLYHSGRLELVCSNGKTVVDTININSLRGCVAIKDLLLSLAKELDS